MLFGLKMLSIANLSSLTSSIVRLAEDAEESSSLLSPDQFAGYLVTGIATIINLLVAYLILKFALFKPLMKVMKARKEAISKQITDAEEKEKQAEEKLDEATRRMDASHEEAMQLIADARTQAEKQSETIIVTAKKEAQDIRDRAEEDAKGTRKAMLEEMKDEVADLAVSIAGRVLAGSDKVADEAALREKALQELSSSEVKTGD
ncbi:MAG: F0F1 ATP synthase subunit B [Clostridiales bacterium]|nr:F0F1 ATP synthase subunit B [Clostridiales bacterium]MBO4747133.1 F0F1 ATP synthase subunit B [Clostridiales bacterium]MBR5041272.1 F0F1 ATP synthase subunit B [Clostridiales bacterium]MBR5058013.1 F0F1 ATP synthase subunit B [Clostridiales bacterium]